MIAVVVAKNGDEQTRTKTPYCSSGATLATTRTLIDRVKIARAHALDRYGVDEREA